MGVGVEVGGRAVSVSTKVAVGEERKVGVSDAEKTIAVGVGAGREDRVQEGRIIPKPSNKINFIICFMKY